MTNIFEIFQEARYIKYKHALILDEKHKGNFIIWFNSFI